jgi:tRNA threonylcarbamoyladenosine biosynthesis protein TsaE
MALGRALGALLERGAVLALTGELGSGKTCLARGVARGLGVPASEPVSSPSFALIHQYGGRLPLYHMDFYRLRPGVWEPDLGLEEYLWGDGVCVVEWADRVSGALPADRLDVRLSIGGPRKREISMSARGEAHLRLLLALRRTAPAPWD